MKAYFIDAKNEFIVEVDTKNFDHKKELIRASRVLHIFLNGLTYGRKDNGNHIQFSN